MFLNNTPSLCRVLLAAISFVLVSMRSIRCVRWTWLDVWLPYTR